LNFQFQPTFPYLKKRVVESSVSTKFPYLRKRVKEEKIFLLIFIKHMDEKKN